MMIEYEREDDAEEAVATTGSRRGFLGAAGGFALAAGGLLLPNWLEETEARDGALDGAAGGRRGKDRRGRHRRRTHGDRKDTPKGPAATPPRGGNDFNVRTAALRVANLSVKPLDCTFYYRIKSGLDDYSQPVFHRSDTITSISALRYDPDRYRVGVLIKQALGPADLYADVRNVSFWYPRGGVWQGTRLDPPGGNVGAALIGEQEFARGEEHQEQNVALKRLEDDSNGEHRIEWVLTIY